ncbi:MULTISPECIES: tripartite tricarboxylate transporter TctB family protein [Actinosynnema]|uniref:tripartite tricarboxylate transporter TctB family protein n=1 Tax=Actinosynnema TaxID=40566 RepID=UPI0027E2B858|nr:tripartite tricarboxylate transporter TctB family protein [Actinosynnema pretiosum]MCP2095037.1 putative tricarboxylic transport membrane protein [Actinosynnema pretiosum]
MNADFLRRRTGLVIPLLLLVTGIVLGVGTLTMEVPRNAASPGPQLFPTLIAIACLVFAVLMTVDVLRRPEPARVADPSHPAEFEHAVTDTVLVENPTTDPTAPTHPADHEPTRFRGNHSAVLQFVGTIVVFIVVLNPLGWLLSGALLFWGSARALGSRRPLFDLFLSLAISSIVQLAFSAGLGLNLPPGILAGVF